ncbi:MAG TPA: sulfotransferase, partial [Candidatus Synoicihabitans sp.]|nr:sulfotransferase [Candidatus Synoicihabitans sp.]
MNKISIHAAPRSGSSWLGEILNSSPAAHYKYQPMFAYRFRGFLNEGSTREEIDEFFERIHQTPDDFCDQVAARNAGRLPTFAKGVCTHVIYKEVRFHQVLWNVVRRARDVRFVFLIRNPFASLASWKSAPREFRADLGWRFEEEWRYALRKNLNRPEEFNGYERWKDATTIFDTLAARYSDRVMLISYQQLVRQTADVVARLFEFCGLPLTEQTRDDVGRLPHELLVGDEHDAVGIARGERVEDRGGVLP